MAMKLAAVLKPRTTASKCTAQQIAHLDTDVWSAAQFFHMDLGLGTHLLAGGLQQRLHRPFQLVFGLSPLA
jgi:hypothetical protein